MKGSLKGIAHLIASILGAWVVGILLIIFVMVAGAYESGDPYGAIATFVVFIVYWGWRAIFVWPQKNRERGE